jgi:hypothetical protein
MEKFYEVQRLRQCKAVGSKEEYYTWDVENKRFATMEDVKAFLSEEYGTSKTRRMYADKPDGGAEVVGKVYHYNTPKTSADDTAKNNQDWVTVREVRATRLKF